MLTNFEISAAFDEDLDTLFNTALEDLEGPTKEELEALVKEDIEDLEDLNLEEDVEDLEDFESVVQGYSDPDHPNINIELSDEFKLESGPVLGTKFKLRVPIAVLGRWQHPQYGDVEFTDQDFSQMIRNFEENVSGFEPPLFYGHPLEAEAPGSAPAVGFLTSLYTIEDVLYGEFDVKAEAYTEVQNESYRYSSAEVVRSAVSKESGEPIGTLLVGCALTNRPFLTRMPKVKALTEMFSSWTDTHTHFLIPLLQTGDFNQSMTDSTARNSSPTPAPQNATATPQLPTEVQSLAKQFIMLAEQVEKQRIETEKARQAADSATRELEAQRLSQKMQRLDVLNLSESVKASFRPMLEAGLPAEQEAQIFAALTELSEQHTQLLTQQQGSQEDNTSAQNAEDSNRQEYSDDNPYQSLLLRNKSVLEQRAARSAQVY
jgi:hypothetical protein